MKKVLIITLMIIAVPVIFGQHFTNYDLNWEVRQTLKTRDLIVTGDVTMDTLSEIIDYTDSLNNLVYTSDETDALLGAKIGTSMVYWEFDSISVSDYKVKITGTSAALGDTIVFDIGGESWFMLKMP